MSTPKQSPILSLMKRPYSDYVPEKVSWLWPGLIALGKLTFIAGEPGIGKSLLAAKLAATVSRGAQWSVNVATSLAPSPHPLAPLGNVLYLNGEERRQDTTLPRLLAANADPTRVEDVLTTLDLSDVTNNGAFEREICLPLDLAGLEEEIVNSPDCKMIVIDPIGAYFVGRKRADIKEIVARLAEIAERHNIAIVVFQPTQMGSRKVTGWAEKFAASARASYLIVADPLDETQRLMLPIKNNLTGPRKGIAFSIQTTADDQPTVVFNPVPETRTLEEVRQQATGRTSAKVLNEEAEKFLQRTMATGTKEARYLVKLARKDGITEARLRHVYRLAGGVPRQTDMSDNRFWDWPPRWEQPPIEPGTETTPWGYPKIFDEEEFKDTNLDTMIERYRKVIEMYDQVPQASPG